MSSTFETIANIIAETCDIPRDSITAESHAINDLGIDSLDFLDIAFAIDKAFGIKLPLEQWTQEVSDGKATTDQYFVLKNLAARIDVGERHRRFAVAERDQVALPDLVERAGQRLGGERGAARERARGDEQGAAEPAGES